MRPGAVGTDWAWSWAGQCRALLGERGPYPCGERGAPQPLRERGHASSLPPTPRSLPRSCWGSGG